jgi:hypothetical protein
MTGADDHPRPEYEEALLGALEAAMRRRDPVPQGVADAAYEAFAWRTLDAELAELTADSLLDEPAGAALVRGAPGPRTLTFEAPELTVVAEVTDVSATERQLVAQLIPARRADVEVTHAGGSARASADEHGRLVLAGIASGPVRLQVALSEPEPRTVRTDWTLI